MPQMIGGELFYSTSEARELKDVSRDAIVKAVRQGRLQAVRFGNSFAISASSLAAYEPASYGDKKRARLPRGMGGHAKKAVSEK